MEITNMRKLVLGLILSLTIASSSFAGTRSCTSSMVSPLNICPSTSYVAYCLPISTVDPDAAGPREAPTTLVVNAFAALGNWQSPTSCTADMMAAAICTSGQLGQLVPITKAQFADLQVRAYVIQTVTRYIHLVKQAEAEAAANAEPTPDIGN